MCFRQHAILRNAPLWRLVWAAIITSLVSVAATPAYAQQDAQIAVNVEPRIIHAGGRITYTIEVSTQDNLQINIEREPNFGDLKVVGRMAAPQFMIRNNQASRQLTITYTLAAPRKPGIYRVEPPIVQVGQSRYTPVILDVKVVDQSDLPAPEQRTDHHFYLDVQVTPDRPPYVGEQILISYDLFVDTRKIQVRPRPPSEPALDAFWIEDLSDQTSGRRKMVSVGSRLLEQTPLRTFIAFPLRAGPASVDSMTIPLVRGSFFGPTSEFSLASDESIIEVQPLPEGAPAGFHSGNVGQWEFQGALNSSHTKVGDPVTLTLTATGRGRASQLRFGELPPVNGLRVIDDTADATRNVVGTSLHGSRTQSITLMPLAEGEITIPAINFSYFDPQTQSYKTISTQPLTMRVDAGILPAEPESEELSVARATHNPSDINATLMAAMQPEIEDYESKKAAPTTFNWFAAAPPVFGFLLLLFGGRFIRRRPASRMTRKQQKEIWASINEQITRAESQADDPKSAYVMLATALNTYFIQFLNFPPGALTEKDLRPFLTEHKVTDQVQTELFAIAKTCNNARYAPSNSATKNDFLATAKRLRDALKQLDKQMARKRYPSRAAAVSIVFLMSFALFTPFASAQDQPTQASAKTINWQQRADTNPNDAILQYNAGVTFAKAQDYPRARLYLERASLLDPGHPAIHQNIDIIRQIVAHNATSKRNPRFSEQLSGWQTAAAIPKSTLYNIFIITLWLAVLALLIHRIAGARPTARTNDIQTAAVVLLWILALAFVVNTAVTATQAVILHNGNPGIVITESPALREGPSAFAALTRTSNRAASGMMVNILESRDGWLKVEISDEAHGWMQSTDVLPIHR